MPITEKYKVQIAIVMTARMLFPEASTIIEALDELKLYYERKPKGTPDDETELLALIRDIEETRTELVNRSVELERNYAPQQTPMLHIPYTISEN
ncbi:MAG: hypothetical protein EPO24_15890 [Bacteroidetes bacterium]|nr:MAG: hypothetical protein EPO24_15890 [Bacteroidota bacterium]